MRSLKILLACSGALVLAASPARADITVGVSFALSGPAASIGIPARNGLAMWPEEIAGEKLKVVILDDAGDPTLATKNARRFVEDKVDVILGSANTPSSIAVAQVAREAQVVQLSPSPAELPEGQDVWTFRTVMGGEFWTQGMVDHMKRTGVKTVAFLGYTDALGEQYLQALNKLAGPAAIKVVAMERFARADTSVAGQALKIAAARPDAVLVAAVGGGAALPHKALIERGYKGKIYHTSASVSPDFLRLAGKDAEGALLASNPEQVVEQLPDSHPAKKLGMDFVQRYEQKFGPGSRSQFATNAYDFGILLQSAVPVALKKGKPGTPEFRAALRDAIENAGPFTVTRGPLKYSAKDHWGLGSDARVMLVVQNGEWKLVR